jgi:hypothetical protein
MNNSLSCVIEGAGTQDKGHVPSVALKYLIHVHVHVY